MGEPACGEPALHLNFVDPSHVLYVQDGNVVVVGLILKVRRAVVSSEEYQEHLVDNAGLLLLLPGEVPFDLRVRHPLLFAHVKRVVVFQDGHVVPPEDDYLIAVVDHVVEGSAVGQSFFGAGLVEVQGQLGHGIVELAPAFS